MIARIWHGYTAAAQANEYEAILKADILPGLNNVRGYRGSYMLRRASGSEIEFVTVLLWESIDAIRAFAGPNYERAIIPDERRRLLSRYDSHAVHYEVCAEAIPRTVVHTNPAGNTT
jgi:heme-degrading monooxygenase HmoA